MNQDDWSAFLKAKLDDRNPKCGNCRHWDRLRYNGGTMAPCANNTRHRVVPMNHFEANSPSVSEAVDVFTTDLSLCSAWEKAPIKPDPE